MMIELIVPAVVHSTRVLGSERSEQVGTKVGLSFVCELTSSMSFLNCACLDFFGILMVGLLGCGGLPSRR